MQLVFKVSLRTSIALEYASHDLVSTSVSQDREISSNRCSFAFFLCNL